MRGDGYVLVVGSIPFRGNQLLFINIFISSHWCQGEKRVVPYNLACLSVTRLYFINRDSLIDEILIDDVFMLQRQIQIHRQKNM